jgi:hypothetical protein
MSASSDAKRIATRPGLAAFAAGPPEIADCRDDA